MTYCVSLLKPINPDGTESVLYFKVNFVFNKYGLSAKESTWLYSRTIKQELIN